MAAAWGWTARHGVHPVLVVAANDKAALGALLRPLPHYGCKGYLIFDGGKALDSGSWSVGPGPLRMRLD
jgi:aminopeptidase N